MGTIRTAAGPSVAPRPVRSVAGEERPARARQDHGHDLPVALVRLPHVVARRILAAPEVVQIPVPVLERDPPAAPVDGAVDDVLGTLRRLQRRIAGNRGDARGGGATGLA